MSEFITNMTLLLLKKLNRNNLNIDSEVPSSSHLWLPVDQVRRNKALMSDNTFPKPVE